VADNQPNPPKLLDQVRATIRLRGMSYQTEKTYADWIKRFILFHNKRHPKEMGAPEIRDFLAHLVNDRNVAASTQNQALHSILFLYREVLQIELPPLGDLQPAKKPEKLPVVFTREEVQAILAQMTGLKGLMASLLYGTGVRLSELLRLRVKDIDFTQNQITVREGKGGKDRVTMLPQSLKEPLRQHLVKVKQAHEVDLREGFGKVELPYALEKKYPQAATEWKWQYVFVAPKRSIDPRTKIERRHHLDPSVLPQSGERSNAQGRDHQARKLPHLPSQLRDASAGSRPRHPHGAGTARPRGCQHDDGLHARAECGRAGREEPARSSVACQSQNHLLPKARKRGLSDSRR
jgi:integron integrase